MPYHARILDPEEYYKLAQFGIPRHALPNPQNTLVGVIEKDDQIVARWMAGNAIVLEGLQIEVPYLKNPVVARKLLTLMLRTLRSRGILSAMTIVQDEVVGELARHAGFDRLPGVIYQKDLRER